MEDFTVSLAGIPLRIIPLDSTIKSFFLDYLCDEFPLFSVEVTKDIISRERVYDNKRGRGTHTPHKPASNFALELSALLRMVANKMIDYSVLLFHSSGIVVNGKAYFFAAPSGTGKTTHTKLWLEQLPEAYVLNGDKPFLKVETDGAIWACGTPWRGKESLGRNEILPLEAICILERDHYNHIREISPKEASSTLVTQTYFPEGSSNVIKTMQLLETICKNVRFYRLGCNTDPEAAQVSINAMVKKVRGS